MSNYDTVVLDIEGTITPITFVHETLFPYVTSGLKAFLDRVWDSPELKDQIELLRKQAKQDVDNKIPEANLIPTEAEASPEEIKSSVIKNINWQMKADRKIGALKSFQGYMWKEGYESGELRGVIYDDVLPRLDQWIAEGKKIYIYSSGSVPAQKLLVGFSTKGDLSKYFSGYFDTKIGLKIEPESYKKIAQEINKECSSILFVSDNIKEIVAASEVGYQVVISDRPGNAPLGDESKAFKIITSFDQIN
ncbi:2,3-diketo-5-methylthio-1-phosphopentane phosphatase [Rhizopus microsporus var. microsporus]|uniref:Enolase-phosphatase E1 n=2 Tax=Rhizopus microsporus TaxID=58291 RepID=A0A2G4TBA6_RHIZD|nr:enolase-phosphatase E1-like protein [Rhizopus microsporus ATCC 52813]ORE10718.1 2,3-diketo-5-methylthio-1-phosphopentane phosphatase [Rhizopus microsporus var. microsporus]PHZ17926.1 enolase-phosphatase E1-like protein [Rhizopus microsporus ATCC 52813]